MSAVRRSLHFNTGVAEDTSNRLRILARMIARVHLDRKSSADATSEKMEGTDSSSRQPPQVYLSYEEENEGVVGSSNEGVVGSSNEDIS